MSLKDKKALVWDHGLAIGLAARLARDDGFGTVFYHTPHEEGFSDLNKGILGYGYDRIEWCKSPWKIKKQVDCIIFPDIEHSGEQEELESQGIPVWGSRSGDSLETNRTKFHQALKDVGLDVPKFITVIGIDRLRDYLKVHDQECYIKISGPWRANWETCHFRSWKLDAYMIDYRAAKLGPAAKILTFMVFDPIDTKLEIGGDTWNIDGRWPSLMLHGDEAKDKSYLAAVTKREEMPPQVQDVLNAFGPLLAPYRYRNFWSMEIRVKGAEAYFGDATTRTPFPSTASHQEIWKNLPEIIWAGAHGELVDPVPAAKYCGEVMVNIKCDDGCAATAEFPKELAQWLKPADCYVIDDVLCFTPDTHEAGWMCAIDDTIHGVIEKIKKQCDQLPDGMSADLEPLAELLTIVNEAEAKGIEFGKDDIPKADAVLA